MTPRDLDAAVAWLLGTGHFGALDVAGRPLGERAAPNYLLVPRDERRRRFGDARDRSGLPCNVAALHQMVRAWPTMVATVRALAVGPADTVARLSGRIRRALYMAPLLAMAGECPEAAAGLYKACLGFADVVAWALLEGEVDAEDPPPTTDRLDVWLDAGPWLIGAHQVCAGGRGQIRALWGALGVSDAEPGPRALHVALTAEVQAAAAACVELEALAATAAGAARARRTVAHEDGVALQLLTAPVTPRLVESLRQSPDAGPLHPALLFAPEDTPESLHRLLGLLGPNPAARSQAAIDAALLDAARAPASRLASALGLRGTLSLRAFANATSRLPSDLSLASATV